jgi:hypothetical protein
MGFLAALVSPVQNIIFFADTFSLYKSPSPSNLGRQACWVACLCVSGCTCHAYVGNGEDEGDGLDEV